MTIPERLRKLAEKSCLTNGETNSCLAAADAIEENAVLRARVAELETAVAGYDQLFHCERHNLPMRKCSCPVVER